MSDNKDTKPLGVNEELVALILKGLETNDTALLPLSRQYEADVWNPAMQEARRRHSNEKLKTAALELVNIVYVAFGKAPISAFVPGIADEDTDCVIQALRDATGLSLDWGEFDGDIHWLGTWGSLEETKDSSKKLAAAWGTSVRINEDVYEVQIPAVLEEFAGKVALEGDYPELVIEPEVFAHPTLIVEKSDWFITDGQRQCDGCSRTIENGETCLQDGDEFLCEARAADAITIGE